MRTADVTTALVLMAGGVLVLWDSVRLGIGWGTDGPKSGFFPFWLAVILLACCLPRCAVPEDDESAARVRAVRD